MRKIFPFLISLVIVQGTLQWVEIEIGSTLIWWTIDAVILLFFFRCFEFRFLALPRVVLIFLMWVIVNAIRGVFLAESYWDYKNLVGEILFYMMPVCLCFFYFPSNFARVSRMCLLFLPFIFLALLPYTQLEAIGKILLIIPPFLIFWPRLPFNGKIYVLLFLVTVFVMGTLGARSTALRFMVAFLFSLLFVMKKFIQTGFLKVSYYICFATPIILFILAMSGAFNVFEIAGKENEGKYMAKESYNADNEEDLSADTRTFLYVEAIRSAIDNKYIVFGHSLSRGYVSEFFRYVDLTSYQRGERANCEVAILNVFTHMGIVGVVLYSCVFLFASWRAVFTSKSFFLKVVGLWVAYRWLYSWVEEFTRFDINYIYIWAFIAMCYSPLFLKMSDKEFVAFLRNSMPRVLS